MTDIYTSDEPPWEPPGIGAIDRLRYHAEAGQDESVPGVSTRLVQLRPDEIIAALDEIAARERAAREKALREAAERIETHAAAAAQCAAETDIIHRIRENFLAKKFALETAAKDVRALIEKEPRE